MTAARARTKRRPHWPRGACRHCPRAGVAVVARGLCARCYYDPAVRAAYPSGKPTRRAWTALELARARAWAAEGAPLRVIAARLGRSPQAVGERLAAAGRRVGPTRTGAAFRRRVAALHAKGLTDREIAARLGRHANTVRRARVRLGLPAALSMAERARRGVAAQRKLYDGGNALLAHRARERVAAARAGWPSGTTAAGARVLAALEAGPRPAAAVAAAVGLARGSVWHQLARLRRAGAVEQLGGSGHKDTTWRLAPACAARRAAVRGRAAV